MQAQALLPPELVAPGVGAAGRAVSWARQRLGTSEIAVVPVDEFASFISTSPELRPGKKDVIALAQILGRAGIGIEPDPRLGGAVPGDGRMVLFAAPDDLTSAASDAYQAATLLLYLAAAVSAADGDFDEAEQRHLSDHLERALHLTSGERRRLHAHLRWLTVIKVKLTGLTRRVASIDEAQRTYVAEFLTAVVAADGRISADEVKTLKKIYGLLGLDPLRAPSVTSAPAPATEPVTVRQARPERGYAIPARAPQPVLRLDEAAITAKLAETARVGALLGAIFTEEEPVRVAEPPPLVASVAGLDGQHSGLLRDLAGTSTPTLSRARFEELTARWSLLPDGALDRINEAGYELAGEPLLDGDDPIDIDHDLLGEMLK
ncbi:tellurite resistance TerB C-terminal domain-containing protein [Nonomuraea sp. NPDC050663]|uniref:tellurite resistance TerB family protein n=1 Tax=Nonomuraea sp. NPDC050663 TaxID=3364370 RepID=UPI003788FA81